MITFALRKLRISFTFGFFFIIALTSLRDGSLGAQPLLFCLFHELGHLAAMKLFGASVSEIKFYGAGICILSEGTESLSKARRALVYLAGPAVNLILAALSGGSAALINLSLAVFNLLPVAYFDGGRLAALIFGESSRVCSVLGVLSCLLIGAAALSALILYGKTLSPSSLMTLFFIAFSRLLDG